MNECAGCECVCVCEQLAAFFSEQMDEMSSWMNAHRYYRRMMQCIADQMEHQVHISWYAYQTPADEELTAILHSPHVDDEIKERESAVGMTSCSDLVILFAAARSRR